MTEMKDMSELEIAQRQREEYRKLLWVLAREEGLSLKVDKQALDNIPAQAELLVWYEPLFDAVMLKGICATIQQPALATPVHDTPIDKTVADLRQALWNIVVAFKRGVTPGQGHKPCLCDKCVGIYDAIRAVRVYDQPGLPNQIAGGPQ